MNRLPSLLVGIVLLIALNCAYGQAQSHPEPAQVDPTTRERYFLAQKDIKEFMPGGYTTNTSITLLMTVGKTKPEAIAIFVSKGQTPNSNHSPTNWVPYADKVKVDLGEGDGKRNIFVLARWPDRASTGNGFGVTVSRSKPHVVITEPTQIITSKPIIQLKGYSPKQISSIQYDVFNQQGQKTVSDANGFGTRSYFDKSAFDFTTNYFQCYDVELSPGTNTIVLRCKDPAGNQITTNLVFVFTTEGDTQPPVFLALGWPRPGMEVARTAFKIRGWVDDDNAIMTGQIVANGETNAISGFPERNGCFWYERIPISLGRNDITLAAADAAGNTSTTNFTVIGVDGPMITLDPIMPAKFLESRITVTGRVSPPNNQVWVNGVQAVVKSDGTWTAEKVLVISPDAGGVMSFEMTSLPLATAKGEVAKPMELFSAQATLSTNTITLNPSVPVCGTFQVHINNTSEHSFILLASTNLIEWEPILTNSNPTATFDYTDTNANQYPCRYFRVVPLGN